MKILGSQKLDFDDVLIRPKPSELTSRSEVNLNVAYICKHSKKMFYGFPLILSNMDTIGQIPVAMTLYNENVWVALHKFYKEEELVNFLFHKESEYSFISMGISKEEFLRIKSLSLKVIPKAICIDAANAYMYSFLDVIKRVRDLLPRTIIMAGNVCTPEGVENIIKAGADIAKCGIANGGYCATKNKTGIGYKQFSVAVECGQAANELDALCCSDGGCKESGDIAKALAAGSHLIMCGSIFSGVLEATESEWNDKNQMRMYGMSSKYANEKYFGGLQDYRTSEGYEKWVDCKGSIIDIIRDIKGGVASCCTYTNTKNLENLSKNAEFSV